MLHGNKLLEMEKPATVLAAKGRHGHGERQHNLTGRNISSVPGKGEPVDDPEAGRRMTEKVATGIMLGDIFDREKPAVGPQATNCSLQN